MAKGRNVLTTGDVAKICNVAPRTVSKWFDSGQLHGYRIPGSKDRRIPVNELIRFMKANNMPTDILPVGKIRVLVVDSENGSKSPIIDALAVRGGYEIQTVSNGFDAGAAAQKFSPHVMIINLLAQGIEATGICKAIRNDPELQATKILAIAGHLGSSECQALMHKGFDDCIEDPSDAVEVIKRIEQAVAIIY